MKLALDFDGVIADTYQSWADKYNQKYYGDLSKDLVTHRDLDSWGFYEKLGIDLDECFEIFGMAWSDWRNLPPMERHLEQKTKMLNNLLEVDIVTAVQPEYIDCIKNWLAYHKIKFGDIVYSKEKEKLDYDIYLDDTPRNIEKVCYAGKIGLLYNQAWNRDMEDITKHTAGSIQRVYNMYHAIDIVRKLV